MNLDSHLLWMALFGGVLALSTVFCVFARWCLHSPAVPLNKLNLLRVGMKPEEVRQLLGEPWRVIKRGPEPEWRFGHRLKRHLLVVKFNSDGKVKQFQHGRRVESEKPQAP